MGGGGLCWIFGVGGEGNLYIHIERNVEIEMKEDEGNRSITHDKILNGEDKG